MTDHYCDQRVSDAALVQERARHTYERMRDQVSKLLDQRFPQTHFDQCIAAVDFDTLSEDTKLVLQCASELRVSDYTLVYERVQRGESEFSLEHLTLAKRFADDSRLSDQ